MTEDTLGRLGARFVTLGSLGSSGREGSLGREISGSMSPLPKRKD